MPRGLVTALVATLLSGSSSGALTDAERCEMTKLKIAAKYASCRLKARQKSVATKTVPDDAICDDRYARVWADAESGAAGACPSNGDQTAVRTAIAGFTDALSSALGGAPLEPCPCGNAVIDGGEECDQENLGVATCSSRGFAGGTLQCGAGCAFDTSGCFNPPPAKVIFATAETIYVGGNPLGYFQYPSRGDLICGRAAAESPALAGKTFKALLCGREPDVANFDYLGIPERSTDSAGGYVRTDGARIANGLADLLDGSIENPISFDQFGHLLADVEAQNISPVWTGCSASGESLGYTLQCSGPNLASWWFGGYEPQGGVGWPNLTDTGWIEGGWSSCQWPRHLYCIEQ